MQGRNPAPYVPNLYRWDRTDVGLMLYDGVRELEISSAIDTYPRAFMTSIRTLAPERTVIRTRHGLDLVPRSDFAMAPALDRLLVPGRGLAPEASDALQTWAAQHGGLSVEPLHANASHLYDATLRDMARHDSTTIALEAANQLEYPTDELNLDGPAWRPELLVRPLALGLLGLGAAIWLRRRPRPVLWSAGRFGLHFAEMSIAMVAGMAAFHVVAGGHGRAEIPTLVYEVGMMVFMTVPMVGWMRIRGHSWRHGTEMAVGMLAPVVVIQALLGLGAGTALPWLHGADGPAMLLGMVAAMLLRRQHYTGGHARADAPQRHRASTATGHA